MRTQIEIENYLYAYKIKRVDLFNIAVFLQKIGKADIEFIPCTSKSADILTFDKFKQWYYDCEPIYNVGDSVRIRRENIDNPCRVDGIKIELNSKPYGCYLLLKSERKGTEQWVNQRNVKTLSK